MIDSIPAAGWSGALIALVTGVGVYLQRRGNLKIGRKENVQNAAVNPGVWKCGSHNELCAKVDKIDEKVDDLQKSMARVEGYLQGRNNR